MARRLRRFEDVKTGKTYYLDKRLGEFRNVDNPHDRFPIYDRDKAGFHMKPLDKDPVQPKPLFTFEHSEW